MSASLKNRLRHLRWTLIGFTLAYAAFAQAEIVLMSVGASTVPNYVASRQVMSSIVMIPSSAQRGTESSYLMQRSLSWAAYQRADRNTGLPLVYVPSVSGAMSATSPRQANVRDHLSRANAYRLRYFDK